MGNAKKKYRVREHQLYTVRPVVWRNLMHENRVDDVYRFRARKIEWAHRFFIPGTALQSILFTSRLRKISFRDHPPVFILGLWRSGTTHLHYLMARDPRFGFLKNQQAFMFNVALLSLDRLNALFNLFVPGRRPQDNVKLTMDDPAEEEQPFSTMTTRSSLHSFFFPCNQDYFTRYHLFEGISEKEKERWKKEYRCLLKNIVLYSGKPDLLLKNPHNTGRVKELLELFPDAKFIFLHRDPFTVYRSTWRLYMRMINTQVLQFCSQREIRRLILENNERILEKYLSERSLIPPGNLVEIPFRQLETTPMETIRYIYGQLDLEGLEQAVPHMEAYLQSVKLYKKNRYRPVTGKLREQIINSWATWFETFGYA